MEARPGYRIRLLGRAIDLVTCGEILDYFAASVEQRRRVIVANHNAHSLYLVGRYPKMEAFYQRVDLIEADSMPLILWGKLMGQPIGRRHQSTYLSWRRDFWSLADRRGWRVFYLGGAPKIAARAAEKLRGQAPGAVIGVHDGYFDMTPGSTENAAVVEAINGFSPDILLVGMGMPRQEIWIEQNHERLNALVTLPVGAAFDYEAGAQSAAPRWLGRIGLEWMFRFACDPRRLFERYFVEPWSLIPAALQDIATLRPWASRPAGPIQGGIGARGLRGSAGPASRPRPNL